MSWGGWVSGFFYIATRSRQAKRPSQCQMAEQTLRLPWVLRAGQCPDTGCLARRSAGLVRYPRGSHSRTDNALFEPPRHPATTRQRTASSDITAPPWFSPYPPPPLRPLISPQASLGGESIISMAVADSRHKPPHQHAASHARYATGLTATAAHSHRRWGGADFRKGGSLQKAAPDCIEPKRPKEQRPTEDPSCTS